MFTKILLFIWTSFLMLLPLGLYVWILRKFTTTRLTDYAGIIGTDPISYPVYHGVVIVDLTKMKV